MNGPGRILAVLGLTACATAAPNEGRTTEERVTVTDAFGADMIDMKIMRDDRVQSTPITASPDAVWLLLPVAYEEIGLPAPAVDRSTWTVAVQNHVVMRRVGSERMSRLIDCGRDMSGDNADTHRINLSVRTWLLQAGSTTQVNTRVDAVATSVEGRAGTITCTSRGGLEQRIMNALRSRLTSG